MEKSQATEMKGRDCILAIQKWREAGVAIAQLWSREIFVGESVNYSVKFVFLCLLCVHPLFAEHTDPIEEAAQRQKEERLQGERSEDIYLSEYWDNRPILSILDRLKNKEGAISAVDLMELEKLLSAESKRPSLSCNRVGEGISESKIKSRNLRQEVAALLMKKGRETDGIEIAAMARFQNAKGDIKALESVVYHFPGTTGAIRASEVIAHYYADHGNWDMASLYARIRWLGRGKLAKLTEPISTTPEMALFAYISFGMVGDRKNATAVLEVLKPLMVGNEKLESKVRDATALITSSKTEGKYSGYFYEMKKAIDNNFERRFDALLALYPDTDVQESMFSPVEPCVLATFLPEKGNSDWRSYAEFRHAGRIFENLELGTELSFARKQFEKQPSSHALMRLVHSEMPVAEFKGLVEKVAKSPHKGEGIFDDLTDGTYNEPGSEKYQALLDILLEAQHPALKLKRLDTLMTLREREGKFNAITYDKVRWLVKKELESDEPQDAIRFLKRFPDDIEEEMKSLVQKMIKHRGKDYYQKFYGVITPAFLMKEKGSALLLELYNGKDESDFHNWLLVEEVVKKIRTYPGYLRLFSTPEWRGKLETIANDQNEFRETQSAAKYLLQSLKSFDENKEKEKFIPPPTKDLLDAIILPEVDKEPPLPVGAKEGGEILKKEEISRRVF